MPTDNASTISAQSAGCAGKKDGTPCGGGGVCVSVECFSPDTQPTIEGEAVKPDGTRFGTDGIWWNGRRYRRK